MQTRTSIGMGEGVSNQKNLPKGGYGKLQAQFYWTHSFNALGWLLISLEKGPVMFRNVIGNIIRGSNEFEPHLNF